MHDRNNGGMNTLWTGIVGAIIGGAAVLLADENTRQSLRKKLMNFMGVIEEKKEEVREKVETELKKTRNKLAANIKAD